VIIGSDKPSEIVGVVGDIRQDDLESDAPVAVYTTESQSTFNSMYFAVRASVAPDSLISGVRAAIHDMDRELPIDAVANPEAFCSWRTATSSVSSYPRTLAVYVFPFPRSVTLMEVAQLEPAAVEVDASVLHEHAPPPHVEQEPSDESLRSIRDQTDDAGDVGQDTQALPTVDDSWQRNREAVANAIPPFHRQRRELRRALPVAAAVVVAIAGAAWWQLHASHRTAVAGNPLTAAKSVAAAPAVVAAREETRHTALGRVHYHQKTCLPTGGSRSRVAASAA